MISWPAISRVVTSGSGHDYGRIRYYVNNNDDAARTVLSRYHRRMIHSRCCCDIALPRHIVTAVVLIRLCDTHLAKFAATKSSGVARQSL
jgi:hypothetical protein